MKNIDIPADAKIHMIGIGGAGMSSLAIVLVGMGYKVSGSDLGSTQTLEKLSGMGIQVHQGHSASCIDNPDLVVASAAVPAENPEMEAARQKNIPIIYRAEMLGWLMSQKRGIAVSGTHGKTSTTSMLAAILESAALDPTILIGGSLDLIGGNAKLGNSQLFLAEACEAFNSFLELHPNIAVVTNIEADHLDCHGSLDGVINSFRKFLSQITEDGFAVVCADCDNVRSIIPDIKSRMITYGLSDDSQCMAYDIDVNTPFPSFRVKYKDIDSDKFILQIPGEHNVKNALAAITVAIELGVDQKIIRRALAEFHGAGRRFEILGTSRGITVIDDYAHHPTEVSATLKAARAWNRRIVAVYQPHLFSRTKLLANEFADSLQLADILFLSEIYPSREKPMPGVSSSMIIDLMSDPTTDIHFVPDKDQIIHEIIPVLQDGDLVIVMGAGDIRSVGEKLISALQSDN